MTVGKIHQDPASTAFRRFVMGGKQSDAEAAIELALPLAWNLACSLSVNKADADDALQDALVLLMRTAWKYDGRVAFNAWLCRLIHSSCRNRYRSQTRRHKREHGDRDVDKHAQQEQNNALDQKTVENIHAAIAALPSHYGEILSLHYFSGQSPKQIADSLNIKFNTVGQRLKRGRDKLRKVLEKEHGLTSHSLMSSALATVCVYELSAAKQSTLLQQMTPLAQQAVIAAKTGIMTKGYIMLASHPLVSAASASMLALCLSAVVFMQNALAEDPAAPESSVVVNELDHGKEKPAHKTFWKNVLKDDIPVYSGRVLDENGKPVSGAHVAVLAEGTMFGDARIDLYNAVALSEYTELGKHLPVGPTFPARNVFEKYLKSDQVRLLLNIIDTDNRAGWHRYSLTEKQAERVRDLGFASLMEIKLFPGSMITGADGRFEAWHQAAFEPEAGFLTRSDPHLPVRVCVIHPRKGVFFSDLMPQLKTAQDVLGDINLKAGGSLSVKIIGSDQRSVTDYNLILRPAVVNEGSEYIKKNNFYAAHNIKAENRFPIGVDGACLLKHIPEGIYQLFVVSDDKKEAISTDPFSVQSGESLDLGILTLEKQNTKYLKTPANEFKVKITDQNGDPIRCGTMRIYKGSDDNMGGDSLRVIENGEITFHKGYTIEGGSYIIQAHGYKIHKGVLPLTLSDDLSIKLEPRLEKQSDATVRIEIDESMREQMLDWPHVQSYVHLAFSRRDRKNRRKVMLPGSFFATATVMYTQEKRPYLQIKGLDPGIYELFCEFPGFKCFKQEIRLRPGKTQVIKEDAFTPMPNITGKILVNDGKLNPNGCALLIEAKQPTQSYSMSKRYYPWKGERRKRNIESNTKETVYANEKGHFVYRPLYAGKHTLKINGKIIKTFEVKAGTDDVDLGPINIQHNNTQEEIPVGAVGGKIHKSLRMNVLGLRRTDGKGNGKQWFHAQVIGGEYVISNVPEGAYALELTGAWHPNNELQHLYKAEVKIEASKIVRCDFTEIKGHVLKLKISDSGHADVHSSGALILYHSVKKSGRKSVIGRLHKFGSFHLTNPIELHLSGMPAGHYTIKYEPISKEWAERRGFNYCLLQVGQGEIKKIQKVQSLSCALLDRKFVDESMRPVPAKQKKPKLNNKSQPKNQSPDDIDF